MICFFLLFIALLSQNIDTNPVTNMARVPTRSEDSRGTLDKENGLAATCDVKRHLKDFVIAIQLASSSLDKETYLYQSVPAPKLPASIESISILDAKGKVKDSTISELIDKSYALPSSGDNSREGEYYIQFNSTSGIRWILIKTKAD